MERLDKVLAATGRWSRREVKQLVRQGQVRVNGAAATSAEEKVEPETAVITVGGEPVRLQKYTYVMLHKPAGVLTATEDSRQRTVLDLLPPELRKRGLSPVGRLDKDTEGLLLLTDDGELAHRLLSPKYHPRGWPAGSGGCGRLCRGDDPGRWTDVPAGGTGAAGGGDVHCDPAGGQVPPGEADAGGQGRTGAVPEAAVYGAADAGCGAAHRRLERTDGGGDGITAVYRRIVIF